MPDFEPKICHEVRGRVSTILTLPAVVMTFWHLAVNFAKICVVLFRRGSKTKNLKSQRLRKNRGANQTKNIYIRQFTENSEVQNTGVSGQEKQCYGMRREYP